MDPVAIWLLGNVVAPDAYTRFVNAVSSRSHYGPLKRAVRRNGIRISLGYRRWLRRPQTWEDLVARRKDAYERLVESLSAEEARGLLRRRPGDRDRAAKLVSATIGHFLPTLDPSMATAVADHRAEQRHDEVMARLDSGTTFEERLDAIPPAAREVLQRQGERHRSAERLMEALAEGSPSSVLASLLGSPPHWLEEAPAFIHLALAQMAQSYGLRLEAAREFEQVADLGLDRPLWYSRAAFEYSAVGLPERAGELIDKAHATGGHPHLALVEAAMQEDLKRILATDRNAAAEDPFAVRIYALALQHAGDDEGAITLLSSAVDKHPDYSGLSLELARLLLWRSSQPGVTSRTRDVDRALQLSILARDSRRKWRGDSGEALSIACKAALVSGDLRQVIRLGTTQPDGDALSEEASNPDVQFSVAEAAIAVGDLETARNVASDAAGFQQALINAELLIATRSDQPEIDEQFRQAWELATSEENRVDVWIGAARGGVEPLPGANELAARTDELPLLVRASQHLALGRHTDAIAILRPRRDSESARRLLTEAYVRNNQIGDAVAELADTADRFDNPIHLVAAVDLLLQDEQLHKAAELADRAISMLPPDRRERELLHEVGVAAANDRADWPELERRVRAWINESGPSQRRRWLLVNALFNQADPDAAWQVCNQDEPLEPETSVEAQLWISLHARYRASPETLSRILALTDQMSDDPHVRAVAVNAFLLMGDDKGEIDPIDLARWHELIRQRAENPAPGDTFVAIKVPDELEELIETFRPWLEPQADRLDSWLSRVRKEGWPQGMLAAASGRPYTSVLVQRPTGFLAVASPNQSVAAEELQIALAALNRPIVLDISALVTAWYIEETWPLFQAAFSLLHITDESVSDSAGASDSLRLQPSGTLAWNTRTGRPVFHDSNPADLRRIEAHVAWVHQQAASLSVLPTPRFQDEGPGKHGAWLTSLRAAQSADHALWADDVGLRTVAQNEGVASFGTDGLIQAMVVTGQIAQDVASTLIDKLRDQYCVDFPLDRAWLMKTASRDKLDWGPAPFTFTRPSTWASDMAASFEIWHELAEAAGATDPMKVAQWVYAGCSGLTGAIPLPQSLHLAGGIVVAAIGATNSDPSAFAACVSAASAAFTAIGLPDPARHALGMAFDLKAQILGRADAASAMARLGSELEDHHKQALRQLLFHL